MATKQTRKEPLTTIAVNQSTIALLDDYLVDKNLSRKEFVEKLHRTRGIELIFVLLHGKS